jgi:hypothetical protein
MERAVRGRIRARVSSIVAVTALVALAGCGGTTPMLPSVPGGSGPRSSGPTAAGSAAEPASSDPAIAWPAFAACLRAHGLDVADPRVDERGQPDFGSVDLESLVTPAVQAACGPVIAGVTAAKSTQKTYDFDSLVAHAACMREHGLPDYPDPDPNAAVQALPPGLDKADPTVDAALRACVPLLVVVAGAASAVP